MSIINEDLDYIYLFAKRITSFIQFIFTWIKEEIHNKNICGNLIIATLQNHKRVLNSHDPIF